MIDPISSDDHIYENFIECFSPLQAMQFSLGVATKDHPNDEHIEIALRSLNKLIGGMRTVRSQMAEEREKNRLYVTPFDKK